MEPNRKSRAILRAFTLVELLVCFTVIAVLIGLILPAIGAVKRRGRVTKSTALTASCSYALAQYSVDHKDSNLFFQTPAEPWRDVIVNGAPNDRLAFFIAGHQNWPNFLSRDYLEANGVTFDYADATSMAERNALHNLPTDFIWSRFWLTGTLFATHEYWGVPPLGVQPESYCVGTKAAQVMYPSAKGIVADVEVGRGQTEGERVVPVSYMDGSAAVMLFESWTGLPQAPAPAGYGLRFGGILATPDGLRGRDR